MRYGYDIKTVARTTENVLGGRRVHGGEHARACARRSGDGGRRGWARRKPRGRDRTRSSRGPGGVFVDGLEADGTQSPHASQQANALALAYGVDVAATVSPGAAGRYVAAHGIATGPMNGLALLRSLHVSGLDADVVRVLTDRKDPGWAHIVASGGTFTWEDWTPSDAQGDSMSHGWGSSALVAFQQDVLGVTPVFTSKIDVRATTGGPAPRDRIGAHHCRAGPRHLAANRRPAVAAARRAAERDRDRPHAREARRRRRRRATCLQFQRLSSGVELRAQPARRSRIAQTVRDLGPDQVFGRVSCGNSEWPLGGIPAVDRQPRGPDICDCSSSDRRGRARGRSAKC